MTIETTVSSRSANLTLRVDDFTRFGLTTRRTLRKGPRLAVTRNFNVGTSST
jgi:hypothetical protein